MSTQKSVIIIGAGIAGLSAGVYAQLSGYKSRVYEMHSLSGGLMTAWKRKGYTIDGCIHWLTGSSPKSNYYPLWEEIGLIQGQQIFDPEVFSVYEGQDGQTLTLYTDADRLEAHLLELAPEDEPLIREMCAAMRAMASYNPPVGPSGEFFQDLISTVKSLPKLISLMPTIRKWGTMTMQEMGRLFKNPFLCEAFTNLWYPEMTAAALVFTLAWLHEKNAGYPLGGSLPMARGVEKRYRDLGGEIHYDSRVEKILVEDLGGGKSRAVGVRLADDHEERADYVISAADGHATLWDMLDGRFLNEKIRKIYAEFPLFPPILLIGLGVNRTFPELPCATGGMKLRIDPPLEIAGKTTGQIDLMVYNFDPTLSPPGKTVLTIMHETSYAYWKELAGDRERYEAEKERIGLEIIHRLDRRFPGFADQVEMVDVATPMTFERYTGNWQASFEGFLPTPKTVMAPIPRTLPNLDNFYMCGQWVQAGGGLPTGLATGREVVMKMCKKDRVKFK